MAPTPEELKEEDRKIRHLRRLADFTALLIIDTDMGLEEASKHVAHFRAFALKLFPDKAEVFALYTGRGSRHPQKSS